MSKLITNKTTARIELTDLDVTFIQAGQTIDLESCYDDRTIRNSIILVENIANGKLLFSDGTRDLAPNEAIQIVRGSSALFNTTADGKLYVSPTNRPTNTFAYFTGAADDAVGNRIGKGDQFTFEVAPSSTVTKTIEFTEIVYFMGADCFFKDAEFGSKCDMTVWAPAGAPISTMGKNGNYNIDSAGVLTPAPSWNGNCFVLPMAVPVNKFVNNYFIMGSEGEAHWASPDVARLFKGWYMKMTFTNISTTKTLRAVVNAHMYRVHSV